MSTITKEQAEKIVLMVNLANDIKELIEPGCANELRVITDKFLGNIAGVVNNEIFVKEVSPYKIMFFPDKGKYSLIETELRIADRKRVFKIDMIDSEKYLNLNGSDLTNNSKPYYELQDKDHTIATANTAVNITNRLIQDPLVGGKYTIRLYAVDKLPDKIEKAYYNFKDSFFSYTDNIVFGRGSKFSITNNQGHNESGLKTLEIDNTGNAGKSKEKLVRYYLAKEMVENKATKYKVYSKNTTTGECSFEYMSPGKVMLDKGIHRFDNHIMNNLELSKLSTVPESTIKTSKSVSKKLKDKDLEI